MKQCLCELGYIQTTRPDSLIELIARKLQCSSATR